MTLNQRRILYILFILTFLIITPLISLYATGYTIGKGLTVQKTGILIVDSKPSGAKIYLNDKVEQTFLKKYFSREKNYIKTPAKIKNLKPGEYTVSLFLDNYWPWEKKLNINPGESTFAEDIYLFKKDLPVLLKSGSFSKLSLSPDSNKLIATNESGAALINTQNEQSSDSPPLIPNISNSELNDFLWSPLQKNIIISQYLFFVDDWSNPIYLPDILGGEYNIKWGRNDKEIFYITKTGVGMYNFSDRQSSLLINDSRVEDIIVKNNELYYIKNTDHESELNVISIDSKNTVKQVKLPYSDYVFKNKNQKIINLYDIKYKILYLVDPFSEIRPLLDTLNNVDKTFWINENKLLYATDYEIWTLDLNNYKRNLLTRISTQINKIIWHPNNNYVIYSTDKTINTIELDDREKHIITNLINLDTIKGLNLDNDGDTIYFYSKIGNRDGVYKLSIQ